MFICSLSNSHLKQTDEARAVVVDADGRGTLLGINSQPYVWIRIKRSIDLGPALSVVRYESDAFDDGHLQCPLIWERYVGLPSIDCPNRTTTAPAVAAAPVRWLRVVGGKLSGRRVIGTASTLPESLIFRRFLKLTNFS